jgi:hypothetical protein
VPGFVIGLPGLVIFGVIGLQLVGGLVFVPLTQRVLGGSGKDPGPTRPAAPSAKRRWRQPKEPRQP